VAVPLLAYRKRSTLPANESFSLRGTLKETLRSVKPDTNQIITPRLVEWYFTHAEDQIPVWVWERVTRAACATPYSSSGRFGGSAASTCHRRQIFNYLGVRQASLPDTRLSAIFNDGKWRHLRWQTILLMAYIIDEIEREVSYDKMHVSGSMDGAGTVPDNHPNPLYRGKKFGFELKGANPYVYDTLKNTGWKKYENQIARYFLADPSLELYVLVVENKATQLWKEWVVSRELMSDLIIEDLTELEKLNNHLRARTLPSMLSMCEVQKGDIFTNCPYGGTDGPCFRATEWPRRVVARGKTSKIRGGTKKNS